MTKVLLDASIVFNIRSGYGRYLKHLLIGFKKYSFDDLRFIVLINKRLGEYVIQNFSDKYEIYVVDIPPRLSLYKHLFLNYKLNKDVLLADIDIWHSLFPAIPIGVKYKMVMTVHDLAYLYYPNAYPLPSLLYWRKIYPQSLIKSQKLVAVSNNTKKDLIKFYKIDEKKIDLVYNSVLIEEDNFNRINKNCNIELPSKYILYVGAINPRKNIDTLIKAFTKAKKVDRIPYKLVLVGSFSWNSIDLNYYIKKYDIENDVFIIRDVSDRCLPEIYKRADLFVYPSLYEGFGYPPLEALSYGVMVLSSNAPPMPEILKGAALYFEPFDCNDLYEKMIFVLEDKNVRDRFITRGREVLKLYSLDNMINQLSKVYKGI